MARDETTYGFNKHDAESLLRHVGGGDSEYLEGKVRGNARSNIVYVAEMKEAWSSNIAECDIYSMDGTTLTDTTIDADVHDPLAVFSTLTTGDRLYVTLQAGKYYAVNNAPCPA